MGEGRGKRKTKDDDFQGRDLGRGVSSATYCRVSANRRTRDSRLPETLTGLYPWSPQALA